MLDLELHRSTPTNICRSQVTWPILLRYTLGVSGEAQKTQKLLAPLKLSKALHCAPTVVDLDQPAQGCHATLLAGAVPKCKVLDDMVEPCPDDS